jgi:hypothetical protein
VVFDPEQDMPPGCRSACGLTAYYADLGCLCPPGKCPRTMDQALAELDQHCHARDDHHSSRLKRSVGCDSIEIEYSTDHYAGGYIYDEKSGELVGTWESDHLAMYACDSFEAIAGRRRCPEATACLLCEVGAFFSREPNCPMDIPAEAE